MASSVFYIISASGSCTNSKADIFLLIFFWIPVELSFDILELGFISFFYFKILPKMLLFRSVDNGDNL
jgi:hypothetical protein